MLKVITDFMIKEHGQGLPTTNTPHFQNSHLYMHATKRNETRESLIQYIV